MQQLFVVLVWIIVIGAAAWIAALVFQIADVANSLLQLRGASDFQLRNRAERRAIAENIWTIAGGAALALVLGFGVDVAVRLWFDWGDPVGAIVLMFALLVVALLGALGVVALIVHGEGLSYAILRANLAEDAGARLTTDQIKAFRKQLEQVDGRKRHIRFGLRDRARLRPIRVRLDDIAAEFGAVPPTGFGAIRPVKWKTANAYVWRGNPLRLIPSLFAILVLAALVVAAIAFGGDAQFVLWAIVALLAAALSFLLAVLGARIALAAKAAWHAVYQKQRLDALRLIEELERSSRKGVAGLGDRVSRALQILRDQQTQ